MQLSTLFYALKYASLCMFYTISVTFFCTKCVSISRQRTVVSVELGMQSRFGVTFSFIQINITRSVGGPDIRVPIYEKNMTNVGHA